MTSAMSPDLSSDPTIGHASIAPSEIGTDTTTPQDSISNTNEDAIEKNDQDQSPVHPPDKSGAESSLLSSLGSPLSLLLPGYTSSRNPSGSDELVSNKTANGSDAGVVAIKELSSHKEEGREVKPNLGQPSLSSSSSPNPASPPKDQDQDQKLQISKPTPKYSPAKSPPYLRLQKTRLSGTRSKQLLRAGSRAHDDPPPPPELGTCCGNACDPCVNDLWREEREVWRAVWGEDAVEGKQRLEW